MTVDKLISLHYTFLIFRKCVMFFCGSVLRVQVSNLLEVPSTEQAVSGCSHETGP